MSVADVNEIVLRQLFDAVDSDRSGQQQSSLRSLQNSCGAITID